MSLIKKSTPIGKGIRTGYQYAVGFIVGLFWVVWSVEGVPAAVQQYFMSVAIELLLAGGVSAAGVAWVQNLIEDRKNGGQGEQ